MSGNAAHDLFRTWLDLEQRYQALRNAYLPSDGAVAADEADPPPLEVMEQLAALDRARDAARLAYHKAVWG